MQTIIGMASVDLTEYWIFVLIFALFFTGLGLITLHTKTILFGRFGPYMQGPLVFAFSISSILMGLSGFLALFNDLFIFLSLFLLLTTFVLFSCLYIASFFVRHPGVEAVRKKSRELYINPKITASVLFAVLLSLLFVFVSYFNESTRVIEIIESLAK